jgi:uncharacterized protein YggE
MKKIILLAMVAAFASSPAFATKMAMPAAGANACTMKETVTVNIQYNFKASTFAEAKKMFDEQNTKVTDFAKKQEVGKFDLQNQNYNIYSQPLNYTPDGQPTTYNYQVTGSSSYIMDNVDAAFKFAEFLTAQKIQVGLNSNSYRQGNCN